MRKDPAVLFYTADFLVGAMMMNYAQRGKYITLLCMQHQQGRLTEDDMLEICGAYDERIFSKFTKDEQGLYYNERLEEEIEKRTKYSQSRSENGSKGGRPPKKTEEKAQENHMEAVCLPYAKAYENHSGNENINENTIKNKINYNLFINLYNTQCFNLSSVYKLTDKRKKAISAFLKQMTIEDFENACVKANNTPFLIGQNDRGWKADFDFIIKPDNAAKIIEGRYENQTPKTEMDRFMEELARYAEE